MKLQVKRFLASRSIALVLQGVPGLYAHGAIGSSNDHALVRKSRLKRDVNRAVINVQRLLEESTDPESRLWHLIRQWPRLNLNRTGQRAFHPQGDQRVLTLSPQVFTVLRTSPEGEEHILTMTNVSAGNISLAFPVADIGIDAQHWLDLISDRRYQSDSGKLCLHLEPYDVVWLKAGGLR